MLFKASKAPLACEQAVYSRHILASANHRLSLMQLSFQIIYSSPVHASVSTLTNYNTEFLFRLDDDDEKIPLYAIILIALATSIAACISTAMVYVLYRSHVSRKTSCTKEHEITVLSNPVTGGKLPAVYWSVKIHLSWVYIYITVNYSYVI